MTTEPQIKPRTGRRARTAAAAQDELYLFLTRKQWWVAILAGAALAGGLFPFYRYISPWVGGAMFLTGVVLVHLRYAGRFMVPFPHIALMMGVLQYVLAAWVSSQYPHSNPTYNIGLRLPIYMEYAVAVMITCAIGWGMGLRKMKPVIPPSVPASLSLLTGLDALIVVGFFGVVLGRWVQGTSLGFIFVLLANLRYVGVYGRMLCKGSGWTWRLALVLFMEVLFATSSAMFHAHRPLATR